MVIAALVLLQVPLHEPKVGSAERKALVDAARPTFEADLKQPVIFEIKWIRTNGEAAFFCGTPRRPNGKPLEYARTHYASELKEGVFDDGMFALMRRRKGKWVVTKWQVGMTDVPWDGMWRSEKLPRKLFPGG